MTLPVENSQSFMLWAIKAWPCSLFLQMVGWQGNFSWKNKHCRNELLTCRLSHLFWIQMGLSCFLLPPHLIKCEADGRAFTLPCLWTVPANYTQQQAMNFAWTSACDFRLHIYDYPLPNSQLAWVRLCLIFQWWPADNEISLSDNKIPFERVNLWQCTGNTEVPAPDRTKEQITG